MRIISGTLGGRKINPPTNMPNTRPTTDIAKEGLFNILHNYLDFDELKTLDLFGGTGNISYELASRGATDLTSAVDVRGAGWRRVGLLPAFALVVVGVLAQVPLGALPSEAQRLAVLRIGVWAMADSPLAASMPIRGVRGNEGGADQGRDGTCRHPAQGAHAGESGRPEPFDHRIESFSVHEPEYFYSVIRGCVVTNAY